MVTASRKRIQVSQTRLKLKGLATSSEFCQNTIIFAPFSLKMYEALAWNQGRGLHCDQLANPFMPVMLAAQRRLAGAGVLGAGGLVAYYHRDLTELQFDAATATGLCF